VAGDEGEEEFLGNPASDTVIPHTPLLEPAQELPEVMSAAAIMALIRSPWRS
jgi:hypothetical protein